MSGYNPFHAGSDGVEQRSAADVFKSSATQQASGIASRFASSGKHTIEGLEAGNDVGEQPSGAAEEEPEFDPDDKRSLYDRLKAQSDAKQEEFDRVHTFKNQMDHWKLDEDEAAWEEERMAKIHAQESEAARLSEEGAQFYKLARAQQDRTALPDAKPAIAPARPPEQLKRKQPMPSALPGLKVLKVQPRAAAAPGAPSAPPPSTTTAATAVAPAPAPQSGLLPGMGAYDDDDEDEDE